MAIASSGNVGIGTGVPTSLLHVYKNQNGLTAIAIDNDNPTSSTSNGAGINFNYGSTGTIGSITHTSNGSGASYNLHMNVWGGSSSYERLTILGSSGNVGIGTANPAQALEVNGQIQVDSLASASATSLCINGNVISSCSSSRRYKENVKDLDMGLDELMKMRPVSFKWKGRDENDFGFIAEEMHDINPVLNTYKDGQIEGVKYPQLAAVIVNAVKAQQHSIEGDHKALVDLRTVTDRNKADISGLRKQVATLSSGRFVKALSPTAQLASAPVAEMGSTDRILLLVTGGIALFAFAGMGGMGIMMINMRRDLRALSRRHQAR